MVAFLGRYQRLATNEEVTHAWKHFWSPPFLKYYYTSEFAAGSNIAGKLLVFAAIGIALANLSRPFGGYYHFRKNFGFVVLFAPVLALGIVIELAQIYLYPFYADATDILTYCLGSWCGWGAVSFPARPYGCEFCARRTLRLWGA